MKTVISIDLGATNLRIGLIDENLEVVYVIRERTTKDDKELLYSQIKRMLSEVIENIPEGFASPSFIGVSACGYVIDNKIIKLPNLHIEDFDLKQRIEDDFPLLKVFIANDANCAAFTEANFGAAKDALNSFFITISSGIGGCLVYNKELIDLPFEIGHMSINYQNKYYEVEQLLSGNGIVNLAKLFNLEIKEAYELFSMVNNKDELAIKVYNEWIKQIGSLIANLQIMFSTDAFVLSGGVMKSRNVFIDDLTKVVSAYIAPIAVQNIHFVEAKFDQDAGLIGGAGLALRHL